MSKDIGNVRKLAFLRDNAFRNDTAIAINLNRFIFTETGCSRLAWENFLRVLSKNGVLACEHESGTKWTLVRDGELPVEWTDPDGRARQAAARKRRRAAAQIKLVVPVVPSPVMVYFDRMTSDERVQFLLELSHGR